MATQVKRRRGTQSEIEASTPALAEWIHNTTDNSIHVGDGVTPGGIKLPIGLHVGYVFKDEQDMIDNVHKVKYEVDMALSVQGEDGLFKPYIVRNTSSDVDLGGGLWAESLKPSPGKKLSKYKVDTLPIGLVTPPLEFNDQLNLKRICDGLKICLQVDPYDLIDFTKNTATKYYVNYTTGDNVNDGLSSGAAFKTLSYAIDNVVAPAEILVEDEWVGYQSITDTTPSINGDIKIRSIHEQGYTRFTGMRESYDQATFVFADEGNGCWSTSEATTTTTIFASLGRAMFDDKHQDCDGVAMPLEDVGDAATCIATPGTQYHDELNKKKYIHLVDGRKPDPADGWMYSQLGTFFQATQQVSGGTYLLENIRAYFNVGTSPGASIRHRFVTTEENNSRFGCKNVKVSGGSGNGVEVYDAKITAMSHCVAKRNRRDGLNYHSFVTTGTKGDWMTVYEYNCIAGENGYDGFTGQAAAGQSENATTCHDSIHIERFNGSYVGGKGSTVADVNGTVSILWCCDAGRPLDSTTFPYIFWHDNYLAAGVNNGMWLWGCASHDDNESGVITMSTEPQSGAVRGVIHVKHWLGQEDAVVDDVLDF